MLQPCAWFFVAATVLVVACGVLYNELCDRRRSARDAEWRPNQVADEAEAGGRGRGTCSVGQGARYRVASAGSVATPLNDARGGVANATPTPRRPVKPARASRYAVSPGLRSPPRLGPEQAGDFAAPPASTGSSCARSGRGNMPSTTSPGALFWCPRWKMVAGRDMRPATGDNGSDGRSREPHERESLHFRTSLVTTYRQARHVRPLSPTARRRLRHRGPRTRARSGGWCRPHSSSPGAPRPTRRRNAQSRC